MVSFSEILAQAPATQTLERALRAGRVHHAYRFEGPQGTGKEKTALALAQALVCEQPTPLACQNCSACRRAVTFADEEPRVPLHPDVVFVGRGLYPQSMLGSSETSSISVEQIRRIVLARAAMTPHEGRALVFIVRAADELTIQAANAMLKTLEEPGDRLHFVLLSHRPSRLLDTIRSRTLAIRFGPLPDAVVAQILEQHGADPSVAPLAQGSASAALELSESGKLDEKRAFLAGVEAAIQARDVGEIVRFAERRPTARDELRAQLLFVAHSFAETGRTKATESPDEAVTAAERFRATLDAVASLEANVQPALVLESMILELRRF